MNASTVLRRIGGQVHWAGLALALMPFASAGFFFDDIYNSLLRGDLILRGIGLGDYIQGYLRTWVVDNGRFFPLAIVAGNIHWWWADSLLKARSLQLGLVAANAILFFTLVRRMAGPRVAELSVLMLALTFQFNPRWDGLTSFSPLNQLVVLSTLAAWCLADTAVRQSRAVASVAAALASACALLLYEIGIVAVMGACCIALARRRSGEQRQVRLMLAWQAVVVFAYAAGYATFRANAVAGYEGIQIGSLARIPATFLAQFASAFPLALRFNEVMPASAGKAGKVIALLLLFAGIWATWLWHARHRPDPAQPPPGYGTRTRARAIACHRAGGSDLRVRQIPADCPLR